MNSILCDSKRNAEKALIVGRIAEKFSDNRNPGKLKYIYKNDTVTSGIFRDETTDIYRQLMIGDSLIKKSGSLDVNVIRDGQLLIFTMQFYCNEKE